MPNVLQTDMFYEVRQKFDIASKDCCVTKNHNADLPMSKPDSCFCSTSRFCTVAFQCDMLSPAAAAAAAAAAAHLKYEQNDD